MEAFGGLFLAQPRLVLQLEKIGLITQVMSEDAVLELQLEALDCWKRILIVSLFALVFCRRILSHPLGLLSWLSTV
jgi:hypothetical protein